MVNWRPGQYAGTMEVGTLEAGQLEGQMEVGTLEARQI